MYSRLSQLGWVSRFRFFMIAFLLLLVAFSAGTLGQRGIGLLDHAMALSLDTQTNEPATRANAFLSTDERAISWIKVGPISGTHDVEWNWFQPDGVFFRTDSSVIGEAGQTFDEQVASAGIDIGNSPPSTIPGQWQVDVFLDGQFLITQHFDIADANLTEADEFKFSLGEIFLEISGEVPGGPAAVVLKLTGPTTVFVFFNENKDTGSATDTDGDGLDQVQTEIVSMELTGISETLGPVTVRVRSGNKDPFIRSTGEIEETVNRTLGVLDLPPFTSTGRAGSFFDVYFEVEIEMNGQKLIFHTRKPKRMEETLTELPPKLNDTYEDKEEIELFDENNRLTGIKIINAKHIPRPDCNNNGIVDGEEIANGQVPDINGNGIPDECELG